MFTKSVFIHWRAYSWFAHQLVRTEFFLRAHRLVACSRWPGSNSPIFGSRSRDGLPPPHGALGHRRRALPVPPRPQMTHHRWSHRQHLLTRDDAWVRAWIGSSAIAHPLFLFLSFFQWPSLRWCDVFIMRFWWKAIVISLRIPLTRLSLSWISYISYLNCIIGLEY